MGHGDNIYLSIEENVCISVTGMGGDDYEERQVEGS